MDHAGLAERYARIKSSLPRQVELIAVSKTRSVEEIRALYDLGQRAFGENYPQELRAKQPSLPQDIQWHMIGHLQSNKVKYLAPFAHLVHVLDSESLAQELNKRAQQHQRTQDVLLQVHVAQEETKHGLDPEEVLAAARSWPWAQWPNLRVRGLMAMASFTEDNDLIHREFARARKLLDEVAPLFEVTHFTELSMGMSGDVQIAIEEGSTMVRMGTALFGPR
jgi:PLP dependent protein